MNVSYNWSYKKTTIAVNLIACIVVILPNQLIKGRHSRVVKRNEKSKNNQFTKAKKT